MERRRLVEDKKYHTRKGMSSQILGILQDGEWHTVQDISKEIGYLETGTSAGLRSLRKKNHGKRNVVGKWLGGVYHYRLEDGIWGEQLELAV
jgi:hypothetical protein